MPESRELDRWEWAALLRGGTVGRAALPALPFAPTPFLD
jgi:hypothetical protein